jgi:hypothetical protein
MNKSNKLIEKLIIDRYFNIYNRNGIEYILSNKKNIMKIFLLDFDNVRELNNINGYKKVNNIFSELFNPLKIKYIIGRAFSGDEIFFCTEDIESDISIVNKECLKYNLTFKYIETIYEPGKDDLNEKLDFLIDNFHNIK